MNALQIADELDGRLDHVAANMLRQQQAEIEALKQIIDANNLNQNIGQFVKLTNEPVAWMWQDDVGEWVEVMPRKNIPFYTHPVKELTDEEMLEIYKKVFNKKNEFKENLKRRSYFDFARAILRKAQEK